MITRFFRRHHQSPGFGGGADSHARGWTSAAAPDDPECEGFPRAMESACDAHCGDLAPYGQIQGMV
jgi:hypothetical protein